MNTPLEQPKTPGKCNRFSLLLLNAISSFDFVNFAQNKLEQIANTKTLHSIRKFAITTSLAFLVGATNSSMDKGAFQQYTPVENGPAPLELVSDGLNTSVQALLHSQDISEKSVHETLVQHLIDNSGKNPDLYYIKSVVEDYAPEVTAILATLPQDTNDWTYQQTLDFLKAIGDNVNQAKAPTLYSSIQAAIDNLTTQSQVDAQPTLNGHDSLVEPKEILTDNSSTAQADQISPTPIVSQSIVTSPQITTPSFPSKPTNFKYTVLFPLVNNTQPDNIFGSIPRIDRSISPVEFPTDSGINAFDTQSKTPLTQKQLENRQLVAETYDGTAVTRQMYTNLATFITHNKAEIASYSPEQINPYYEADNEAMYQAILDNPVVIEMYGEYIVSGDSKVLTVMMKELGVDGPVPDVLEHSFNSFKIEYHLERLTSHFGMSFSRTYITNETFLDVGNTASLVTGLAQVASDIKKEINKLPASTVTPPAKPPESESKEGSSNTFTNFTIAAAGLLGITGLFSSKSKTEKSDRKYGTYASSKKRVHRRGNRVTQEAKNAAQIIKNPQFQLALQKIKLEHSVNGHINLFRQLLSVIDIETYIEFKESLSQKSSILNQFELLENALGYNPNSNHRMPFVDSCKNFKNGVSTRELSSFFNHVNKLLSNLITTTETRQTSRRTYANVK